MSSCVNRQTCPWSSCVSVILTFIFMNRLDLTVRWLVNSAVWVCMFSLSQSPKICMLRLIRDSEIGHRCEYESECVMDRWLVHYSCLGWMNGKSHSYPLCKMHWIRNQWIVASCTQSHLERLRNFNFKLSLIQLWLQWKCRIPVSVWYLCYTQFFA